MSQAAQAITRSPAEIVRLTPVSQAANGVCYASAGEIAVNSFDLERMVAAVPLAIAAALQRKAYYFVPLTVSQGDDTVIADRMKSTDVIYLLHSRSLPAPDRPGTELAQVSDGSLSLNAALGVL